MPFNKLLNKQISKYLPSEMQENEHFAPFIKVISDTYQAFERDINLMNHAFEVSDTEFKEINANLEREHQLKKEAINKLYQSIRNSDLDASTDEIENEEDSDDLLFVSNYLHTEIQKRKKTERALSRSVLLFKTLLANLQSGILVEDENRKILFTNQLFCDTFSIPATPDSLVGTDCSNSAEQSKSMFKNTDHFIERIDTILKERTLAEEEILETVDGKFLSRDYIPIFINKVHKGNLWKYTDITQSIQNRRLLEQSEEQNRVIMNASLNGTIIINSAGVITLWNEQAEKIFGWKQEEVLGKTLGETIIPQRHHEGHTKGIAHYIATKEGPALNKQIELPALNKQGVEFPIEISITPIHLNGELSFCSFIQDISERKNAEANLRIQEEKYRNIITNMNLGLIEVDLNEKIQFVNQSFELMSGFSSSELIGKTPTSLFVSKEIASLIENKKELRKKGISDIYQIPVKNKRGELRWWAISAAPNYDDSGNFVGSVGIHLDITEQKELEIALGIEKEKAQQSARSKEAFLANMSHEIRTPLNAIIGFLRELNREELSPNQRQHINNSTIASKHLLSIINNILDISKIEAGEMTVECENMVLQNSIENVIAVLESKAKEKGLLLNSFISNKIHPILQGDSLRIEQVLFNLIGNAIKFTQQGFITVHCELRNDYPHAQDLRILISDTGIGMDQQFVNSIFKKFSQEDKTITRKFGGTGLGMSITHELIQLMNGTIEIESTKNKGTTITIDLQFPKGHGDSLDIEAEDAVVTDLQGISILLVEDNEINRMVAQNSLSYYNCRVTEAVNGIEALKVLENNCFDVILMDLQMPEMDGIEATQIIRNERKLTIPIIALTANAFKSELEQAKAAGMNDHITKPFEEEVFIRVIAKHTLNKSNPCAREDKLYHLGSLLALSRGNNEFIKKMISIFITQTQETLDKAILLLAEANYTEIGKLFHKIKPSIDSLEIHSITAEVLHLEQIGKEENPDSNSISSTFEKVKNTLSIVIEQLKQHPL